MTSSELDPRVSGILETCLEAIQTGAVTVQDCLERYPSEAPLIQRELQLAALASRLKSAAMSEAGVEQLEARLRTRFRQQTGTPTRLVRWFVPYQYAGKWAAAVMMMFLLALGAGGGTVAASANSLPGESLYGVKRAWESVVVLVASLVGRADEVWLHLAQVRFEELIKLAESGRLSNRVLEDFSNTLVSTIQSADSASTPDVVTFLTIAESQLQPALPVVQPLPGYERMAALLKPLFDNDGHLIVRGIATPVPDVPVETPIPPSATPTATPTMTNTPVPTMTDTATLTPTGTQPVSTATSRFPATATRTPSPAPSAMPTITVSPAPTLTWTPLPSPGGNKITPTPVQSPSLPLIGPSPTSFTPIDVDTLRIRETQSAVYAMQTAIALGTFEPTATP